MVINAATFGRSGAHDFVLVRATALILTAYILFLTYFFVSTPSIGYAEWHGLFSSTAMKIFTLITLVSLFVHAWIGMWQVLTDYVKSAGLRALLQFLINVVLLVYVAAGFVILWGV